MYGNKPKCPFLSFKGREASFSDLLGGLLLRMLYKKSVLMVLV